MASSSNPGTNVVGEKDPNQNATATGDDHLPQTQNQETQSSEEQRLRARRLGESWYLGEVTYDLKDLAFCFTIVKRPDDLCSLTTLLTKRLSEIEKCKVQKLDEMFNLAHFATKECKGIDGCSSSMHTPCIRKMISEYFERNNDVHPDFSFRSSQSSSFLRSDIKVFLQSNSHTTFTPRAVTRIMHGIPSPAFPCATWSNCHFWGRYSEIDFAIVMKAATLELMDRVKKGGK